MHDILKIEVLGVSLPWTGIFTKNSVGTNFINRLQETTVQSNSVRRDSDMSNSGNPFLDNSSSNFYHKTHSSEESTVGSAKKTALNHGIDLLTGDLLSNCTSQPDSSYVTDSAAQNSVDVIDFFDSSVADHRFQGDFNLPAQVHDDNGSKHSNVKRYLQNFKSLSVSNKVSSQFYILFCLWTLHCATFIL